MVWAFFLSGMLHDMVNMKMSKTRWHESLIATGHHRIHSCFDGSTIERGLDGKGVGAIGAVPRAWCSVFVCCVCGVGGRGGWGAWVAYISMKSRRV